jgi:hypothetical protein
VRRLALLVMAAVLPWLAAHPVAATMAPGIQGFKLTGTVDRFPCLGSVCGGTLSGLGAATVAGQATSGAAFTAEWPDPTQPAPSSNTTGSLTNVLDSCLTSGPIPSDSGTGKGSFSLAGGLLDIAGQGVSSGATLSGNFDFAREADGAVVITVSAATITNNTGLVIAYQANLLVGVGGGGFAVTNGMPTCAAPLAPAQVAITASYLAPE